jgi:hypothetical protein
LELGKAVVSLDPTELVPDPIEKLGGVDDQ